jgi:hypothetical protein
MQAQGQLKPFTVRLPVTTLAILEKLNGHVLWSKQELVYQMINGAIAEYYEAADEAMKASLDKAANEALEQWGKQNKGKVFDIAQGKWKSSERKSGKRAKK